MNGFIDLLRSSGDRLVVVGHRGDSFHAPENTLEAARLAHAAGAQAWELDVQLTRDGVPVVLHDESLERTTDVAGRFANDPRASGGYRVADFDWSEIRDLDAGSWFVRETGGPRTAVDFGTLHDLDRSQVEFYQSGKVRIPTLADALVFTKEHDWLVNVEIKAFPDSPTGLLERALGAVAETGTATRVLISSFDHTLVAAANVAGRTYGLGILVWTPHYRVREYAQAIVGADAVHISAEALGSESIAYRRQPCAASLRGHDIAPRAADGSRIYCLAYTVNAHGPDSLADHFQQIGIQGLFTDDPAGLAQA